jgi:hypothetical protein
MAAQKKKELIGHVAIPLGPHIEEYLVKPAFDADGVQVSSGIGVDGREYPDPTPMSPPVGYEPPSDLNIMLEQLFRRGEAVLRAAEIETEEEANDFDIDDDPLDPLTPYEKVFEPPAAPAAQPASSTPVASPGPGTVLSQGPGTSGKAAEGAAPSVAPPVPAQAP